MRILLVSQFYPPVVGGIEIHVSTLASTLVERGHDVAVATLAPGADGVGPDGVAVHRLGGVAQRIDALHTTDRRHAPPIPDPGTVSDLRRLIGDFRPDVVHAHNWLGRSFVPLKRGSGARYVVTLHDCGRACAQGRMMYRGETLCEGPAFSRCLGCAAHVYGALKGTAVYLGNVSMGPSEARAVDAYVAVSDAIARANRLSDSGVRFEVIPNFVREEPDAHTTTDPRLGVLPSEPYILQVGDVVADKGVRVLLEAYGGLAEKVPLVLIGRNEAGVADDAPAGVTVLGSWPHELIGQAWRRSLLGTMPSLCLDASPTVTLEAMAVGRPVVASALGGLVDQVDDGVTGFLVEAGDASALREAIERVIGDAGLREAMGRAARERFERHFAADVVIDRIEQLYTSLLEAP